MRQTNFVENLYKEFKEYWDQCSPSTRSTYGEDYYNKSLVERIYKFPLFMDDVLTHLGNIPHNFGRIKKSFFFNASSMRQPEHQVHQVIDAVAGTRPRVSDLYI